MSDGDGEALAYAIRAEPALRGVALVLLASVDQQGGAEQVRAAGFSAYLVKPVRASLLMDALLAVWGAGPERRGLVTQERLMAQPLDRPPVTRPVGVPVLGRVLLAEDNPVNQQVAAAILERLGLRVDVAGNGKEALEQLALLPYDLVFMDCEMPEMDGYAATAEIRRQTTGAPRIPIVAMTAHAMEGDRERCLAAGMDDYVTKPVNPAVIEAVIRRWIRTSRDGNGTPPAAEAAAVLDRQRLTQLRSTLGSGDGSLFRKVVEAFLGDTRARLVALRHALDRDDREAVRQLAHTLRGSCLNLGALRMTEVATALERVPAEARPAAAPPLVAELEAEFRRTEPALLGLL
jgi:CheY-like chemotaxis protein/HPt (histidine-containing phosphotransfer) domain-containing protein